jgi:hypothetical protein
MQNSFKNENKSLFRYLHGNIQEKVFLSGDLLLSKDTARSIA